MRRPPFAIPRELLIRGKRWLVVQAHELGDDPRDARQRLALHRVYDGQSFPEGHPIFKREIHIGPHSDARKEASTFLHELLHACSTQSTLTMRQEEAFIRDVEAPLLRALEQLDWKR